MSRVSVPCSSAPFDCAFAVLTLMAVIMSFTWTENYGDERARVQQSFVDAVVAIRDGPDPPHPPFPANNSQFCHFQIGASSTSAWSRVFSRGMSFCLVSGFLSSI